MKVLPNLLPRLAEQPARSSEIFCYMCNTKNNTLVWDIMPCIIPTFRRNDGGFLSKHIYLKPFFVTIYLDVCYVVLKMSSLSIQNSKTSYKCV
jgi:hypothetical protein